MLIESTDGDYLILEACKARFGSEAGRVYAEFCELLNSFEMPFALREQMRRIDYPPTKGWENGMPPVIYYFVPETGWGSEIEFPEDPLGANFVYSTDAIGLNFGCPLRLFFALKRLKKLNERGDLVRRLSEPNPHLAAVEELLWADLWAEGFSVNRAVPPGNGKWFDWLVEGGGDTLNVECKFRPSDWPRLVDGDGFRPITLLEKAAKQLPATREKALNIVAITGFAHPGPRFLALLENELRRYPHIDALAYATLAGELSVHSLNPEICERLVPSFALRRADYFQTHYFIFHHRAQKDARIKARTVPASIELSALQSRRVPNLPSQRLVCMATDAKPYRSNISSRNPPTNEPHFEIIPSHLLVPNP